MDLMYAGIVGLVFILLIVFTVLASKTWHWINIVFVILTFIAGVGASIGLAQVYKLRNDAMKDAQKAEELALKNQKEADLAVYGSPESIVYDRDSLRGINEALALALAGRGRVWSGGQVVVDGDLRTFTFATARPADDENQIKLKNVLLYVFADGSIIGQPYPQSYIGTVLVTEETPQSIKLQPMFIANGQEWSKPSTSWSLFEKMPLDRRGTFKLGIVSFVDSQENPPEGLKQLAEGIRSDSMDIGRFRQALMQNYLTAQSLNLDPASAEYEKLIDRYAFDGISLGKIQNWIDENAATRVTQRFEPTPEEVFIRYRFDQKSSRAYQVDADGSLETDGAFTPLGQAIEPSLQAGKEIEFGEGDTVLVDQLTAEGYQRGTEQIPPFTQQEEVTEVDRVYIRQLRDFPYVLGDLYAQTTNFIEETDRVRQNNGIQEKSLADAEAQLQDRLNTTAGLEMDNGNLKNDLDTVTSFLAERQEENRVFRARIQSLMDQIMQRYQRIEEMARQAETQAFAGR